LCRRESFCADEDLPWLDAYRDELFRRDPGIVGELAVNLVLVFCAHDEQHSDAPLFGSGERSGEDEEAAVCERVHEGCMLVNRRLLVDPSVTPAGSRLADDREGAPRRRRARLFGALIRSRRGLHVKDVELLLLRHELEILRRQAARPKLRMVDRALLAAAAYHLPRSSRGVLFGDAADASALASSAGAPEVAAAAIPESVRTGTATGLEQPSRSNSPFSRLHRCGPITPGDSARLEVLDVCAANAVRTASSISTPCRPRTSYALKTFGSSVRRHPSLRDSGWRS